MYERGRLICLVIMLFLRHGLALTSLGKEMKPEHRLELSLNVERGLRSLRDTQSLPENPLIEFLYYPQLVS